MDVEEKIDQLMNVYCSAFENFSREIEAYSKWFYDLDEMTIEFSCGDNVKKYDIVPVGTFSSEYSSFLWTWANEEYSEATREASSAIKSIYKEFPFKALNVKGFSCKAEELDEILALSLYHLKGKSIFKIKDQDPWLFLCVL